MSRQDRQGVRTPADIERKYDLGKLAAFQGLTMQQEQRINQLSQTMQQYMATTNAKLEKLEESSSSVEAADVVESGNMLVVTSNAVALALAKLILRIERLESGAVLSETNAILGSATLGKMILGREV